jgi:hypothetical protein
MRSGSRGRGGLWQKILLVLMLERGDPAGIAWIGPGEVDQGALARGGADSLWWRVGAGKIGPQVGLIAKPARQPTVGGGDGKGEVATLPDVVQRESLGAALNQRQ